MRRIVYPSLLLLPPPALTHQAHAGDAVIHVGRGIQGAKGALQVGEFCEGHAENRDHCDRP
jgi:hypothetical protein